MKGKFSFLAVSAMLLATSCSSDEVTNVSQDNKDVIRFSINADGTTRAAEEWCNKNLPGSFNVYAASGSKLFIDGDEMTNGGSGSAYKSADGAEHFWPESGTVDFYAIKNSTNSGKTAFDAANGALTVTGYTVNDDVTKQNDLIYAVKKGQTKASNSTGVELNFRHALAQMVFRGRTSSKNLYVKVKSIEVANLVNKGDFALPNADTDDNQEAHNTDNSNELANQGAWTLSTVANDVHTYSMTPADKGVHYHATTADGAEWLTGGGRYQDNDGTDKIGNVLMLIPQSATATEFDKTKTYDSGERYTGNYMIVDIEAYNLPSASTSTDDSNLGNLVSVYKGKLIIRLGENVEWNQGKRYIYTLVFGKDGGGENPDNPDDPDPVFVSVKYEVTVDDFIPVDNMDDIEFDKFKNESK